MFQGIYVSANDDLQCIVYYAKANCKVIVVGFAGLQC
jgi:hypothetical protein